jgi:hypothetical protein
MVREMSSLLAGARYTLSIKPAFEDDLNEYGRIVFRVGLNH